MKNIEKEINSSKINIKLFYLIKALFIAYSFFIIFKLLSIKYINAINYKKYFKENTYRLAFIFGTRPEAIKLFPLIKELKKEKQFICIIINTGQHKEMIKQIFKSLKMEDFIDFDLNLMKKNQSLEKITSETISELENIYNLISPNAVIVQGDTTTAISASISAFYHKIPIFHVEAGLRTHNFYYPFPEEFNRVTIDEISTLYFAPTEWAASNLLKENKNLNNIFITGNTIVDSLKLTLNNTYPSENVKGLIQKSKLLCLSENDCKIILLTFHRRENYYKPIYNILKAVQKLLKNYRDIVIIFPFHLNPNVQKSIKNSIPKLVYEEIIKGKKIKNENYIYLNRLIMIPPLNYIDLIHLESSSYFIMSDSGGIQEEAVSIGKPILILRENTERPEAIKSGIAFLTGTSSNKIYNYASSLLLNKDLYLKVSKSQKIYGMGNSSIIITKIIKDYFYNNLKNTYSLNSMNYQDILNKYDESIMNNNESNKVNGKEEFYDIIIVLTVWKRNNLERQLIQIKNQSILKNKKTNIIIFQNSNHVYIDDIVNKWNQSDCFSEKVNITFIHSPIETGYFGRFVIPLTSSITGDSYFFICDDDVIWGNRYFENMFRVVNEGYLCTRNGRIINSNFHTSGAVFEEGTMPNKQVCYNEDIEYDFGGHIWAGRISWLRKAWNHIPFSLENCEDFWISAALKSFYNISTKTPRCPCPEGKPIVPDLCAASDNSSILHQEAIFGNTTVTHKIRHDLYKELTKKFNYPLMNITKPEYVKNIHKKYIFGDKLWDLTDDLCKNAVNWVG